MDSSDESDGDFVPGQASRGGGGGSGSDSDGEPSRPTGGGSDGDASSDDDDGEVNAGRGGDSGDDAMEEDDGDDADSDAGNAGMDDDDDGDDEEGRVPSSKTKSKDKKGKGKRKDKSRKKSSGGGSSKGKRKRGAAAASRMFDDEAEESDRGSGASDEDDEDDEDNEYKLDGFVVGDDDASEDEKRRRSKNRDNKRKRLRKAREDHGMEAADDEDLELIREAQGVSASQTRESDRNELVASDGRDLGKQLFDGEAEEAEAARRQQQDTYRRSRQRDEFDSEDDGDFIVDDLGTEHRQGSRHREESFQGGASGPSQDQVYEALEIFGEGIQDFDMMQTYGEEDGELGVDGRARASKDARMKALAGIEPSLLKEKFLTEQDKLIQETDRPERLQLRMPSRGEASDEERRDEAQWICNQLDLGYNVDENTAKKAVEHVLRFLGVESQEVPFIWHYRRDYLWTGPQTYLTREHLWKIYELDETWDKVGNRREKVAKASGALWKLMDGTEDSDKEGDEGYFSETADARDERLAEEETAKETRLNRLRRSEQSLANARKSLETAENEAAVGPETIDKRRLSEAQVVKAAKVEAKRQAGETVEEGEEDVGEGEWQRATAENLAEALSSAKEAFNHANSYIIGLKGELRVEEDEEAQRNRAREARHQERKDAIALQQQLKRDEARSAMEEEAALFPSEQYSFMLNSQEEIELKDMQDYLALVSLMGESEEKLRNAAMAANGEYKRRPRRAGRADDNLYRAARQAGLRGLANKFSITAAQLGEILSGLTMARYPVPTPLEPVDLVASDMAGASGTPLFDSSESILRGVRHILAREIAAEPRVKSKCRQIYRRFALVSTNPTSRGKEEIDAFHPLYGLHYLSRKDLSDFLTGEDRTQWLKIEKGKNEGLLTYTIHPPERLVDSVDSKGNIVEGRELDTKPFLHLLDPPYNPDGGGMDGMEGVAVPVKKGWDHQRSLVLQEALVDNILPSLETEVVLEMKAASRAAVVEEASRALARRLAVGPYEREELSVFQKIIKADSELNYDQVRVVGIFVGTDNKDETWAAAIDPSGSVLDHLQIPYGRDARAKKLKAFIRSTRPHVVCVSTSAGQSSRYMMDTLLDRRSGQNGEPQRGVVPDAHREYQDDRGDFDDDEEDDDKWKHCTVVPVRDDVASIFGRSTRGEKEFAEFSVNQRAAVSLARYLQDPLVEMAGMWTTMDSSGNFGYETFSLRLHPLQDQVPPQQLLRVWTHRLMDAVSEVGVDINHAAEHEHAMGVLQFVPGLGPRKAAKLREKLGTVLGGVVPSRKALLSSQLLKSLVYTNAAGFLRVRDRGKLAERLDGSLDPFDDTRVHPECYNTQDWGQRICANALDVQVDDDYFPIVESAMDDSREALQRFCQQDSSADASLPPMNLNDSVNQLDLSAYADELERQGEGKRALQLDSIVEEIRYPYRDRRTPYTRPEDDELFEWLTGETDATLREGVLVPVRVTRHNDAGVRVRLEGGPGLFGFVPADYVTDDVLPSDPITGQAANLRLVVKENQLMEAAIIKVDKSRFELKLSLRKSDTRPNPDKWDMPHGVTSVFSALGWNRPHTLPRLDPKFDAKRAQREARERIKDAQKKASDRANRGGRTESVTAKAGVRFPRSIMHPQYKNFTHLEAEAFLTEMSDTRGEALIRPSSKGMDHLSLTWMWIEGEFMHTDIQELGKQPGSTLAPRLKIRGEEYEDLDEIISRRVSACNDLVNDLLASNKYNAGTVDEVEDLLRKQKSQEPNRIPYLMCRRGSPGYVNLMYLPSSTVKRILVEITPEGYVMSKRCFKTLPELFKWFKLNAQQLSRTASRSGGRKSRPASQSNSSSQQPPLPPDNDVPPPPPPRPSGHQQYPAYNGGAYGYNPSQPQPAYAAAQAGYFGGNGAATTSSDPASSSRAGSRWGQAPAAGNASVSAQAQAYQAQYGQQQQQQQQQQQWYGDQQNQQQLYQQQYQDQSANQYQYQQHARDSSQARE